MSVLFFDIDNTLFSHRTFSTPDSALKALKLAKKNGHRLVLCSGRGVNGIRSFYDETLFDGAVCSSGGVILWKGKPVAEHPIESELVMILKELALKHCSGVVLQGIEDAWVTVDVVVDILRHGKDKEQFMKDMKLKDVNAHKDEAIYKLDYFFPSLSAATALIGELPEHLTVCQMLKDVGYGSGCEIEAYGVDKGTGVTELMKWLGEDAGSSYGFGDSENDIRMLEACDIGIAMGNAVEEVKSLADYTTTDIDADGIAHALEHFHLI